MSTPFLKYGNHERKLLTSEWRVQSHEMLSNAIFGTTEIDDGSNHC
jgi:hypothetical protein